jgi:hypothetical protein
VEDARLMDKGEAAQELIKEDLVVICGGIDSEKAIRITKSEIT